MASSKRKRVALVLVVVLLGMSFVAAALAASFAWAPLEDAPVVSKRPAPAQPVTMRAAPGTKQKIALRVTRVAHSTVLIEFENIAVLTDPWFSERWHFHHGEPLGRSLADLPKLDAVVVSHEHYDHFDVKTFARYAHRDVPMFVQPSMVQAARDAGFTDVRGIDAWQQARAGEREALTITALPGKHGVPEITFMLQAYGFSVYFGGDTLLIPELRQVADRFAHIDLALVPINGLRAMGDQVVMNAEDAATLVSWLKPRVAVPIHYRFHGSAFTDSLVLKYDGTPERFRAAVQRSAPGTIVRVLEPGQLLSIVRVPPEEKEPVADAEAAPEPAAQSSAHPTPAPTTSGSP